MYLLVSFSFKDIYYKCETQNLENCHFSNALVFKD